MNSLCPHCGQQHDTTICPGENLYDPPLGPLPMSDDERALMPDPDPLLPFRAILDWWMCSDPWPANEQGHIKIEAWLNEECKRRGYESWVDAYHQEPDVVGAANCWDRAPRVTRAPDPLLSPAPSAEAKEDSRE